MAKTVSIVVIFFNVLNILCHSIGSYLLISVYRKGKKTVQQILLINLSITELVISFPILAEETLSISSSHATSQSTMRNESKNHSLPSGQGMHNQPGDYLYVVIHVLFCSYYLSMIYITADRFFGVLLNIKYPVYWSTKRTKILIFCTSCLIVALIIALTVTYRYYPFNYTRGFCDVRALSVQRCSSASLCYHLHIHFLSICQQTSEFGSPIQSGNKVKQVMLQI